MFSDLELKNVLKFLCKLWAGSMNPQVPAGDGLILWVDEVEDRKEWLRKFYIIKAWKADAHKKAFSLSSLFPSLCWDDFYFIYGCQEDSFLFVL